MALSWLGTDFRWSPLKPIEARQTPDPTPTIDRLATPALPASPAPSDFGRQVYYLNCMPCHGDVGQGLTDEWRAVWVEDHQNCWARGCHGGREEDEGFPIPQTIPAVIGTPPVLGRFQTAAELDEYLRLTHPPQRPGALSVADYHTVTALLWEASGRSTPQTDQATSFPALPIIVAGALLIGAAIVVAIRRRQRSAA